MNSLKYKLTRMAGPILLPALLVVAYAWSNAATILGYAWS